jgi:hypothetical protein
MPYLRRIMSDGINVIYLKALLKRLTRPDNIKYIIRFKKSNNHMYQYLIKINNIKVIIIRECSTKNKAVIKAVNSTAKLISQTKP